MPMAPPIPTPLPPVAAPPAFAVVTTLLSDVALKIRSWAPVNTAVSSTSAAVTVLAMFNATDAPIPTLPAVAPSPAGFAVAVLTVVFSDVKRTSA